MERYLYNTDPIIGGFAMFFKNHMNDRDSRLQKFHNRFTQDIAGEIERAGVNFRNIGDLGRDIGDLDTKGVIKDGKFVPESVWSLLTPFKNHQYVKDKFDHEIRELKHAYLSRNNAETFAAYMNKVHERNEHMKKWFQRPFVDSYYSDMNLIEN